LPKACGDRDITPISDLTPKNNTPGRLYTRFGNQVTRPSSFQFIPKVLVGVEVKASMAASSAH